MLRIFPSYSASGTKRYFDEELSTGNYYLDDYAPISLWGGKGAEMLGLSGEVGREEFHKLCDNRHPFENKQLTAKTVTNRRIGYDFNFHCPKSVSILYGLSKDQKLLEAFRLSVRETMEDMEQEMQTRVRVRKQDFDRDTKNMIWSEFVHDTSRPVGDLSPDPHLHSHVFVMNATFDKDESRWKAGQFFRLKRDATYYEACFHSRLSNRIAKAGFGIEKTRHGWEIAGVNQELITKFSNRTTEINQIAEELGISDPVKKSELGAKTRKKKVKDKSFSELQKDWLGRLTPQEKYTLSNLNKFSHIRPDKKPYHAMEYAVKHMFERKSVVPEKRLWAEALKFGVGSVLPADIKKIQMPDLLIGTHKAQVVCTTQTILNEERQMFNFARDSLGTCPALNLDEKAHKRIDESFFNTQQKGALKHILTSIDRVILLSGAAGVGKTTIMQEAQKAIEAGGNELFAFAPSTDATNVLKNEGFQAETMQKLLLDKDLQNTMKGKVILIDEAGLPSVSDMNQLFKITKQQNARLLLVGDSGQHSSVERGDALRLLEKNKCVMGYRLATVVRQQGLYKEAVQALSKDETGKGFDILELMGAIVETNHQKIHAAVANEYIKNLQETPSVLVIAPTHAEGDKVVGNIRKGMHELGWLKGEEREFTTLRNLNFTEAQRADARTYQVNDVICFHKRVKNIACGEKLLVKQADKQRVVIVNETGKEFDLQLQFGDRFNVFTENKLGLREGDKIRVTRNSRSLDNHKLINGSNYSVKKFDKGNIILENGWVIDKEHGHFTQGYVATSQASQGKTVDKVIVLQSEASVGAITQQSFYVSVSRARKSCKIFTDAKDDLREWAERSQVRVGATELKSLRPKRTIDQSVRTAEQMKIAVILQNHRVKGREMPTNHRSTNNSFLQNRANYGKRPKLSFEQERDR